jgi:shikimate kinase
MERIVLATGGGANLLPENRSHLASRGCVIYLETSVSQQVERVKQGRTRPLLNNVDTTSRLSQLLVERAPLYREIADVVVSTDGRKVRSVAEDILRELGACRA